MTTEQIQKFFAANSKLGVPVTISFRQRDNVTGIFIQTPDFEELKRKNYWRIVSASNFEQWKLSNDYNLCRMFNGTEFTRLVIA